MILEIALFLFSLYALFGFYRGFVETIQNNNPHGKAWWINFLGAFVWTDALVLSPFWLMVAVIGFVYPNVWFLGLIFCVFWLVRSAGEVVYWLNQQFAESVKDKPEDLWPNKFVNGSVVWFVMQLTWQMGMVFSLVGSVYFTYQWLANL